MSTIGISNPLSQAALSAASPTLQVGAVIDALVLALVKDGMVRLQTPAGLVDVVSETPLVAGATVRLQVAEQGQWRLLAITSPTGNDKPPMVSVSTGVETVGQATASAAAAVRTVSTASPSSTPGRIAAPDAGLRPEPAEAPALPPNRVDAQAAAVAVATRTAVVQQRSLAPLLADLQALVAEPGRALPAPVREAAAAVLALRVEAQTVDAGELRAALTRSGLFLESRLAATPEAPGVDLKSALLALRGALQTWRAAMPADAATTLPVFGASAPPLGEKLGPAPNSPAPTGDVPGAAVARGNTIRTPAPTTVTASGVAGASRGSVPDASATNQGSGGEFPIAAERAATGVPATNIGGTPPATPSNTASATLQVLRGPVTREPAEADAPRMPPPGLPDRPELPAEPRLMPSGASHGLARVLLQAMVGEKLPPPSAPGSAPNVDAADAAPPPPYRNGLLAAQPAAPAGIAPDAAPEGIATRLLAATDGALARQTLTQIASLPDTAAPANGPADRGQPLWTFELPLRTPQGTAILPFEIGRDGRSETAERGAAAWQARFSTDFAALGPVHAQVTLTGERAAVTLWAEREVTAGALKAGMPFLEAALREAALEPGSLRILLGAPRNEPAGPGKFLDQAT